VAKLVLKPLGLEDASFFPEEIETKALAVGHGAPRGDPTRAPVVLEPRALARCMIPAGGLVASVTDELRYARFHLGDGTVNGTKVLSAEGLERMQAPLGPGGSTPWSSSRTSASIGCSGNGAGRRSSPTPAGPMASNPTWRSCPSAVSR
jgi:CubicO group peptidase (beta-lactamase class C family)